MSEGAVFDVIGGPFCLEADSGNDIRWYQVRYNGMTGWSPEASNGTYFLEPYNPIPVGAPNTGGGGNYTVDQRRLQEIISNLHPACTAESSAQLRSRAVANMVTCFESSITISQAEAIELALNFADCGVQGGAVLAEFVGYLVMVNGDVAMALSMTPFGEPVANCVNNFIDLIQ